MFIDSSNDESRYTVYMDKGSLQMTRSDLSCDAGDLLFLGHGSPLIDARHPSNDSNDANGTRSDIGPKGAFLPL